MTDLVGKQLGKYRLTSLLGRGGFAEVYQGEHIYLKSQAAIKVLRIVPRDEEVKNFLTEAQKLVSLAHPHIVRVLNFEVENGVPFLVMEYASHGSLRQRYPIGTRIPYDTIMSYVRQVSDALQYAHNEKLIHRDVKPENMLLGQHDDLHCNAVRITGGNADRLEIAAIHAADASLEVWFSPFTCDLTTDELLDFLTDCAERAERLRRQGAEVVFVTGAELSLFTVGFLPGDTLKDRLDLLAAPHRLRERLFADPDSHQRLPRQGRGSRP